MVTEQFKLQQGQLWERIVEQTESALKCGALQPILTEYETVNDGENTFLVRMLSNLIRKDEAKKQQEKKKEKSGKAFNPFLPYEKDLFVADLSATHVCLLNKFNVVDYHVLMITRDFEDQESWLTVEDFEAMWICLKEVNGLVFYNGGKVAGASQRHKHLQLVPFPLVPNGTNFPLESAIASTEFEGIIGQSLAFPFVHAIARFEPHLIASPSEAASVTLDIYFKLLESVNLPKGDNNQQTGAYNLLATRDWIMVVPRSQEHFESISVNSLGFAGALLVRNQEQMQRLKECQPMNILKAVSISS